MRNSIMAGESEIITEPHDIEACSEQRSAVGASANIASQVGKLILLMLQALPDLPSSLSYDFGHRHAGMKGQAQRQHVRNHARNASRDAVAGADRQTEDHMPCAAQAMQEYRRR